MYQNYFDSPLQRFRILPGQSDQWSQVTRVSDVQKIIQYASSPMLMAISRNPGVLINPIVVVESMPATYLPRLAFS